jgi:hypothetical protein
MWTTSPDSLQRVHPATISNLEDRTTEDPRTGAMRSVQAAEVSLPEPALDELWSPMYLERLARTYWRFLQRVTLGLVRVRYTPAGRALVLVLPMIKLICFAEPEYELDGDRGIVRWRIVGGLLLARRGHGEDRQGHLQIEVRRLGEHRPDRESDGRARLHVEVEVANFHPAIASGFGRRVYNATQARIHVLVTHGFLRSLARLRLAESRVGRFA